MRLGRHVGTRERDAAAQERRRLLLSATLQAILLLAAAYAAISIRRLVTSERFSDQVSLSLTCGATTFFGLAAALAKRAAFTKRRWQVRVISAVLPLGLLVLCAAFTKASLVDTSVQMEAIVAAEEPAPPATTVVIGPGGKDVRLVGELREGVAHRLASVLDAHPEIGRIHLTSEGGLADEGQALGQVIAAHRLTTFVPDYCVSACTLAFVRGRQRLMLPDARIGFHAPYEPGLFGAMYQRDASDQRAAYLAAGVSPNFVAQALQVDPAGIWFPTIAELRAAHVVTASVDRYTLPDSDLDDTPTLEGARTSVLQNFPILKGFLDRAPRAVDTIAVWYLDAYRQGHSEGEDVDALDSIVSGAVAFTFAGADDGTLLEMIRYLGRALAVAREPSVCEAIGGDMDVPEAARQVGKSAADEVVLLKRALDNRAAAAPKEPDFPVSTQAWSGSVRTCADWRRIYAYLLSRPGFQAAAAARSRLMAISSHNFVVVRRAAPTRLPGGTSLPTQEHDLATRRKPALRVARRN